MPGFTEIGLKKTQPPKMYIDNMLLQILHNTIGCM